MRIGPRLGHFLRARSTKSWVEEAVDLEIRHHIEMRIDELVEEGLSPEEALAGMTREAARVLGFSDRGAVEVGLRADLACWRMEHPAELSYWMGGEPAEAVFAAGRRLR